LFALAAIGTCVVLDAALLRVGLDELDEGYFVEQATRVLRGAVPYRDFDSLYTPGLLYLNTIIFTASGGPTVIGPRLASLAARAFTAVGLYAIGRSLAPWYWAIWPPVLLLTGLDVIPMGWEPHPAWEATLGAVVVALLVAQAPRVAASRCWLWMSLAGAAAAITFLFKQNTGVLIGLAVVAVVALDGLDPAGGCINRSLRWLQVGIAVGIVCLVIWLIHPFLDVAVLVLVVTPAVLAMTVLLLRVHMDPAGVSARQRLAPLIPFAAGGLMITLPWLTALLVSLNGHLEHLGPFVGALDQKMLFSPLQLPGPAALFPLGMGAVLLAAARARTVWLLVVLFVVAPGVATLAVFGTRLPDEPATGSVLLMPGRVSYGIVSLVPALAAWSGWYLAHRQPPSLWAWRLRWYLTIGSLLLITQYPRMDALHLAWSATLLLVVGAVVMAGTHAWLTQRGRSGRFHKALVASSLFGVLLVAALPGLYDRASVLYEANPNTGWPERTGLLAMDRPRMIGGFRLDAAAAYQLRDVLAYLDTETSPDEPIFVYPSSPLLYVLADRPNPTRFSHVYPGMSTADQQALTSSLDSAGVHTIVVSDAWLDFWGSTESDGVITAYLHMAFQERARFGVFRVMTRRTDPQSHAMTSYGL
jgi:hypothetical protein